MWEAVWGWERERSRNQVQVKNTRLERVRRVPHKLFGGHLGALEVAPGHLHPADEQLARAVAVAVAILGRNLDLAPFERLADVVDGDLRRHDHRGLADGGLGDAIGVDECERRGPGRPDQRRDGLAAERHDLEVRQVGWPSVDQRPQRGGREHVRGFRGAQC